MANQGICAGKSYYSMGGSTLKVPMTLFSKNRERLRESLTKVLKSTDVFVLLQGGKGINHYSADTEYMFRQESYFHWMFGVTEPDFYGGYHIKTCKSYLFMPCLPPEYAVWMGKLSSPSEVKAKYGVDLVFYVDEIESVIGDCEVNTILTLSGTNSDSGLTTYEAHFKGIEKFNIDQEKLFPIISECRVIKTEEEIEVIKYANEVSSRAHKKVMKSIAPNMYEYQGESIFQHYCYLNGGCRNMSYTCICGTGNNSSILHYGHASAPNDKLILDGDMCLFDMGCMYYGYTSDITCSFPANGKFNTKQKNIYNAVLHARDAVIKAAKPGVLWSDLHLLANRVMLVDLVSIGLLKGEIDDMLNDGLAAIFQPHGLGHLLGCDVHDVGGYLEGHPTRSQKPGLSSLRTARNLLEGMVLTVEPGCYFIDTLLDKALHDESLKKYIINSELEKYRNFGGVRIEDNIVIRANGVDVLTKVPRTTEEIEDFMRKA